MQMNDDNAGVNFQIVIPYIFLFDTLHSILK